MKIELKRITEIRPYENNPRVNDGAVDAVAASIREFGFQQPIVVDADGVIIAGHTRYKAALQLGLAEVPVVVADTLTPDQVKAYRLADNKTGELATWDFAALDEELAGISELDMTLFGFEPPKETEADTVREDDFDAEPPKEPKSKPGDIYRLGEHRLMCGDSAKKEDWDKLMGDDRADMVFTDPPYGVAIGSKNERLNQFNRAGRCTTNIEGDTISEDKLHDMLKSAFENVKKRCKEDAVYYVTSPQGGSMGMMMTMMRDAGLPVRHILIWVKSSATFSMGRLDYDYKHEPIFYTWGEKHHNYREGENRTTIWEYDKPRKCDVHPTMKPVKLVANAIMDGSQRGDIVLDAFGGSGTTLIAAEQLGRKARLMEIDPHYVDVIISRWEAETGQKAVKEDVPT